MTNLELAVLHPHMAGLAYRNQVAEVISFLARRKPSVWNDVVNAELSTHAAFGLPASLTGVVVAGSRFAPLLLPRRSALVRPLSALVVPVLGWITAVVALKPIRDTLSCFGRSLLPSPWCNGRVDRTEFVSAFPRACFPVFGIARFQSERAFAYSANLDYTACPALPRTETSLAAGLINRELHPASLADYLHLPLFALVRAGARAVGLIQVVRPWVKRRAALLADSLSGGSLYPCHALIITRFVGG